METPGDFHVLVPSWCYGNSQPQRHENMTEQIADSTSQVAKQIVNAAFTVHSALGAGLLESVYQVCLEYELTKRGLTVDRQIALPVIYDNVQLEAGFQLDLLVNHSVVVELKAVETLLPVHIAQVITYLKLSKYRLGLLINFNVPLLKNGIRRIVL